MVHTHCCEVSFGEDTSIYLSILPLMDIWGVAGVGLLPSTAYMSFGTCRSLGYVPRSELLGHRCAYMQLE